MTLPKAMLERFHLETGDTAYVVETEEGILITPFDPTFGRAKIDAPEEVVVRVMAGVASSEVSEEALVEWLRGRTVPLEEDPE